MIEKYRNVSKLRKYLINFYPFIFLPHIFFEKLINIVTLERLESSLQEMRYIFIKVFPYLSTSKWNPLKLPHHTSMLLKEELGTIYAYIRIDFP